MMTFSVLRIGLITRGSPAAITGGHLYHRRVAALAPRLGAHFTFLSLPERPFPVSAARAPILVRDAERRGFDVLLLDSLAAACLGPTLSLVRLGRPIVGMLHQPPGGMEPTWRSAALQAPLDRLAWRSCRLLVVASDALAQELRRSGVTQPLRVIPPGRNPAGSVTESPPSLRHGRRMAVLTVANWAPCKGILELLEALACQPPDALTLHLVGDPDVDAAYAARIRARLRAPDLAGRVVVHGRLPAEDVPRMYAGADVFALASWRETYGTVYGEAMAAGLPVVGWRAGNLANLARHGHEGLLAEAGDVQALAEALTMLAHDPPMRARLGAAAALRAQDFPTWEQTTAMLVAALRDVAAGAEGAPRPSA